MKPLRAFPLPLNVGTDICQISRIYNILTTPRATRFVERVLAREERPRLASLAGTLPLTGAGGCDPSTRDPEGWKVAAFMAGRFAAKEAAIKAHAHRRLTLHDVVIERRAEGARSETLGSGPPVARIRAAEEDAEEDESALISISHDGDYATAVCLAHDPGPTR
ncbi:4'-phosphopantetheinyl transferase [Cordyceps fumosorosea ARSEF 2679]|uniref:4'-phosphopantetheinyl transferase n=1 Tax=Cordyceps fumosorosea (strain ARSEF 2679) TaxID=1081104 RepID=A0A167U7L9_CORFA|nr:4'-phosphopantetheinyl transferase [Cordyceps fumosorosea ARSEF 2679]OAA61315.1 4'-phosphopantetheinyl transferase [Cordyceps fumosorosea ARSEF 2679]